MELNNQPRLRPRQKTKKKMKAKSIKITYEINGRAKVARHSDQTVVHAVRTVSFRSFAFGRDF